ncbi:hypothetical protein ACQP3J_32640, partial [Escherichia coli]
QYLVQLSAKKLPVTAEGNKYRDPSIRIMQSIRDFGRFSPKWDFLIKSLPSKLRELYGQES